jgi:PHD/YefM family antitoxin component YafN of YafNO toxin-antitoxin module
MGIFTGLLTLPLAPIRGTVWIAEQLAAEAERELHGEKSARRRLAIAERQLDVGVISLEEYEAIEEEALDRLEAEEERQWQT